MGYLRAERLGIKRVGDQEMRAWVKTKPEMRAKKKTGSKQGEKLANMRLFGSRENGPKLCFDSV